MTSETIVRYVNIALQIFGIMVAAAMMSSFRDDLLRSRSQRLFFAKIATATACMICFVIYNLRGAAIKDPLDSVLLSMSHLGVYVVYYLYIEYLSEQIEESHPGRSVPKSVSYISLAVCLAGSLMWIVYASGRQIRGINAAGFILIIITFYILNKYYSMLGKRNAHILGMMPFLMLLATLAEPHARGIELHCPLIIVEFCIVYTQHHLDVARQRERDEIADTKARLALATGRIKPHYLYNVLTTIYYLCETDPLKARDAIGTFSEYMRNTLETLESQELVSFSWELGEIRHYLDLEKLRYGDRLRVEYDIEAEDFLVPPLSVQPLVENAVKHGIANKEEGGTVRIESFHLPDGGAQIRITDDGVGFDVTKLDGLDVTHEGIANVRERIRLEVGGDVTIESVPGEKTTAVVTTGPQTQGDRSTK